MILNEMHRSALCFPSADWCCCFYWFVICWWRLPCIWQISEPKPLLAQTMRMVHKWNIDRMGVEYFKSKRIIPVANFPMKSIRKVFFFLLAKARTRWRETSKIFLEKSFLHEARRKNEPFRWTNYMYARTTTNRDGRCACNLFCFGLFEVYLHSYSFTPLINCYGFHRILIYICSIKFEFSAVLCWLAVLLLLLLLLIAEHRFPHTLNKF